MTDVLDRISDHIENGHVLVPDTAKPAKERTYTVSGLTPVGKRVSFRQRAFDPADAIWKAKKRAALHDWSAK